MGQLLRLPTVEASPAPTETGRVGASQTSAPAGGASSQVTLPAQAELAITATPIGAALTSPAPAASPGATLTPPTAPPDALALLRGNPSQPVSDLLFIAGNQLLLWQRRSQQVRVLAQAPEAFVSSNDGAVILTLHALNDVDRFEVKRIDAASGVQKVLLGDTARPELLTMTADGKRAAFALKDDRTLIYTLEIPAEAPAAPASATPFAPNATAAPAATIAASGAPATSPLPIGACESLADNDCSSLAWGPDGRSLVWTDGRGVWMADAVERKARLLHDLSVDVADPKGQVSTYEAYFDDIVWSPDGRFILLRVKPKDSRVMWRAVLDVRSGKLASASDSFAIEESEARVAWLAPDRIMVAHASDLQRGAPPFIHLWNVFATNPQLLVSGRQYDLYSDEFPFSPQASKSIPAHHIDWLSAIIPGKVLFGVKLPATQTQPVLFTLDLTTGVLVKIQALPPETDQVAYAPDSSGALIGGSSGFAFATLTGAPLIDLNRVFSMNTRQMQWLAPGLPRKR